MSYRLRMRAAAGAAALTLTIPIAALGAETDADQSETVAQTAGSGDGLEPAARTRGIEEITVTARKRAEPLQDTPIAITAFSQADLKDQDIRAIDDISASTPNLQIDRSVGSAVSTRVYLRGVGNGDAISSDDPGVGIYIDGVYLPRAQGSLLTVSDLEQVEVLRGPQGTLFGKNTIGGAVVVTTQKPSYDFGGVAELRLGYNGLVESRASLNVPLIPEMAAMRVSFASGTSDGYVRNRLQSNRTADNKILAGRVQFLLNPTPTSELLLSLDHSREPRSSNSAKCKLIPGADGLNQGGLFRFIAPEIQTGCQADDARSNDKIAQDGKSEDEIRTYGTTLTGTFDLTDTLTLKSISAWRRNKTSNFFDTDATQFNILNDQRALGGDQGEQDFVSQEFTLSGLAMDGRLKWTAGAFWFYETNQTNDSGQILAIADERGNSFDPGDLARDGALAFVNGVANFVSGATGQDFSGVRFIPLPIAPDGSGPVASFNGTGDCLSLGGGPLDLGAFAANPALGLPPQVVAALQAGLTGRCAAAFRSLPTRGFFKTNQTSYAGYGELTYDVTDALSITAGLRFTHERKRVSQQEFSIRGEGVLGSGRVNEPALGSTAAMPFTNNYELSDRFDKWTPRFILQYRFNDDVNAYASYSRGFKSGTFSRASDGGVPPSVDPEVLTAYELGFKSRWLDNRLTVNVAGFLSYYDDVQLTSVQGRPDGTILVETRNAGEARILGTELEVAAVPIDGLVLSSSIGLTAARYTKFDGGRSNAKLPGTPALTMSYQAQYTTPFLNLGDLRTTLRWFHEGEKASDIDDPHITRVNKHGLLSGRMALELNDGVTELAIVGRNLLDREYFANGIDLTDSVGTVLRYYAPGRGLSVEFRRAF